jgi:hypothetical protein
VPVAGRLAARVEQVAVGQLPIAITIR